MKKKIIGFLLITLLILTAILPLVNSDTIKKNISFNNNGNKWPAGWNEYDWGDGDGHWELREVDGSERDPSGASGFYPIADFETHSEQVFDVSLRSPTFDLSDAQTPVNFQCGISFKSFEYDSAVIQVFSDDGWEEDLFYKENEDYYGVLEAELNYNEYSSKTGIFLDFYYYTYEFGEWAYFFSFDNVLVQDSSITYLDEDFEDDQDDTQPPTSILYIGEPNYENYVTSETLFSISAEDNPGGSGVAAIYYRIEYQEEWTDWIQYSQGFNLEDEGPHTIEYYSVDYSENTESTKTAPFNTDNHPPGTTVSKEPQFDWYIPNKWALICNSGDNDGDWFIASALQGYYTLKNHGYHDDNIILLLCHDSESVVHLDDNTINILNGPDGIAGNDDDPVIDHDLPESGKSMKESLHQAMQELAGLVGPYDEVLIYLIGHGIFHHPGTHYAYFDFEDGNRNDLRETWFARWVDEIHCHKIVVVGDFCYSGCFLDTVESCASDRSSGILKPIRIIISSAGEGCPQDTTCDCCSMYGKRNMEQTTPSPPRDFAGGYFSRRFWMNIDRGFSYQMSCGNARSFIPIQKTKSLAEMQDPRMVDLDGNSNKNSPTEWENVVPYTGNLVFSIEDEGGISFGESTHEGSPVGGQDTYYRIMYNDNWGPWTIYTDPITFTNEGYHEIEWYSTDLLGNTGEITNHVIFADNTAPNAPELTNPAKGATDYLTPTFDWEDTYDDSNVKYTLQISTNTAFTNIVLEKTNLLLSEYPVKINEALDQGTYYWRVKATDGLGFESDWSEIFSFNAEKNNNPPNQPDKPTGPTKGVPLEEYEYGSMSTDEDNDRLHYVFDWGDDTKDTLYWNQPGESTNYIHYWHEETYYSIKVKAIDEHGEESPWSEPLTVSMPKTKSKTYDFTFLILKILENYPLLYKIILMFLNL